MRRALDQLYRLCGGIAACFMVAICAIVLAQVALNLVDVLARAFTGTAIGLVIPSYSDFAGFFLAAATFFALAYALRRGAHIRVTLFIRHAGPRPRRVIEAWCTGAAALVCGYFALYAVRLMLEAWRFGDLSSGMVPVPLWIPRVPYAVGLVVLTIALVDELVTILRGRAPAYELAEEAELAEIVPPAEATAGQHPGARG